MIPPYFAYLDPGTGSIVIQSIIAGIIGFFVALKLFWFRIVGLFKRRKPNSSPAGATEDLKQPK